MEIEPLRVVPRRRECAPGDAVVLHGMFSGAGSMRRLASALDRREWYDHVARYDLPSWKHTVVPQMLARQNAEELARKKILPALDRGALSAPLDLIGHSNGGYVCLYLAAELGPRRVRGVYTLGTPRGLPRDYPVPVKLQSRVYHLRGGVDGVPTGGDHAPGDGEWIITFPDEGHCSLHQAADTNGVADLVCFLAGMPVPHLFVDEEGTIHPWEWCRDHAERAPQRVLGSARMLRVCDGVHDAVLDTLKATRKVILQAPVSGGSFATALSARLAIYLAIRARLVAQQEALDEERAELRAFGGELKREIEWLRRENCALERRLAEFDRRVKNVLAAFRRECQYDVKELTDALTTCERLAKAPAFGNREVAEVNALLQVALIAHRRLNERVQSRAKLPAEVA
jgi:pimeloyl-ACP methyl ester carboxylesterase